MKTIDGSGFTDISSLCVCLSGIITPTDNKSKERFCSFTHFLQQDLISSFNLSLTDVSDP